MTGWGFRAFAVVVLVSVSGAAAYFWQQEIQPSTASHRQLFIWLVTHDVRDQSVEFQQELFLRCRHDMLSDSAATSAIDWQELSAGVQQLNAQQEQLWHRNLDWYAYRSFANEADQYRALPESARQSYLAQRLPSFMANEWPVYERFMQATKPQNTFDVTTLMRWSKHVEDWISNAEPKERETLQKFWTDLRWYLLWNREAWPQQFLTR
jgi:hypothetical protein